MQYHHTPHAWRTAVWACYGALMLNMVHFEGMFLLLPLGMVREFLWCMFMLPPHWS